MKKLKYLIFVVLCNIFFINVYAANASITARAQNSSVQVGDTVKVTVTVSTVSSVPLGAWEFSIGYDSNILTYVSSTLENGLTSAGYSSSATVHSKTYTLTFKAKAAGTGTVTIKNPLVVNFNTDETVPASTSGATIVVSNPKPVTPNSNKTSNTTSNKQSNLNSNSNSNANNDKSKSADNYLTAITLSGGYELSPKFDKNTTNYSVSVPNDVRKIIIGAKASDDSATIVGVGAKELKEGKNKFSIVVTAENGNRRTYVVNVTVKDKDPIVVKIGDNEYSLVQKNDEIEAPSGYTNSTVNISATDIPAFTSDITKLTLVGLTDSNGNTNLYIYSDDTYTLYKEYGFSGVRLFITTPDKENMLKKAKEIFVTLDGENVKGYQLDKNTYPLLYGMNVETGEYNWYTYDSSEKTVQKYVTGNRNSEDEVIVNVPDVVTTSVTSDKFENLTYILCGMLSMLVAFLIAASVRIAKTNQEQKM